MTTVVGNLTERERVAFLAGRRDALEAVAAELAAFPDAARLVELVELMIARAGRVPDYPPPLCGYPGIRGGAPILCGLPMGHELAHAWEAIPPDPPPAELELHGKRHVKRVAKRDRRESNGGSPRKGRR